MIKRMILMIVVVAVIVGGMIGFKFMMAVGEKVFIDPACARANGLDDQSRATRLAAGA